MIRQDVTPCWRLVLAMVETLVWWLRATCFVLGTLVATREPLRAQSSGVVGHTPAGALDLSLEQPGTSEHMDFRGAGPGWNALLSLAPGQVIVINTDTDVDLNGRLVAAHDDRLEMAPRRQTVRSISRASVRDIRLARPRRAARWLTLGLAVGAVTGYAAGSAAACSPHACGGEGGLMVAGATTYGLTLGIIGGLVAAQADGSRPGRLIYQR